MNDLNKMSKYEIILNITSTVNLVTSIFSIVVSVLGIFALINGRGEIVDVDFEEVKRQIFVSIVIGIIGLIAAVLGYRACKDASKVKPILILSAVFFALNIANFLLAFLTGSTITDSALSLLLYGFTFYASFNINKTNKQISE